MKILVTGGDGQLGKALQKVLPKKETIFTTKNNLDITDKDQVFLQFQKIQPNIVIHTAAYTDVDGCEKNPLLSYNINTQGTKNIAEACSKINAIVVYISTDFVFDGRKKIPYIEEDNPNPLSVYGKTKLQGEEIIRKLPRYFIIRTSWLFGEGKNFIQTILKLAKEKEEIQVVNDQFGSPTYALDLANAILKLLKTRRYGIYHITNVGQCSWYSFTEQIARSKELQVKIVPITSDQWQKIKPQGAKRPPYSVLDHKKINALGIKMRSWQEALEDYFKVS